jgi:hypothetical protein
LPLDSLSLHLSYFPYLNSLQIVYRDGILASNDSFRRKYANCDCWQY